MLLGLATVLTVCNRGFALNVRDELTLLLPALAVLVLVSSQTGFNRYLRYVLPALPFFFIFASGVRRAFDLRSRSLRVLCWLAVAASIFDSLWVYPHSMSYFNLLAGGPLGGRRHLLDANIDWGQDLLKLKRFVDIHPEATPIRLAYFGYVDPKLAGFPFEQFSPANEKAEISSGWYAISVNHLFGYRHYESDRPIYTRFQRFSPKFRAGYSIDIYHVTREDLDQQR